MVGWRLVAALRNLLTRRLQATCFGANPRLQKRAPAKITAQRHGLRNFHLQSYAMEKRVNGNSCARGCEQY